MHEFKLSLSRLSRASVLMTCLIAIACGDPDANWESQSQLSSAGARQPTEHVEIELALSTLADSSERYDLPALTRALVRDATESLRDATDSPRDGTTDSRDGARGSRRDATSSPRGGAKASAVSRVSRRLVGLWRTKTFEQGAWVDLIWVIGKQLP